MQKLSFFIESKFIEINLKITKNKNMYLKINHQKELVVLAPEGTDLLIIKKFVFKHIDKFNKYLLQAKNNIFLSWKDNYVIYLGKKYLLKFIDQVSIPSVKIHGNMIWILTQNNDLKEQEEILNFFLKKELKNYLNNRQLFWETKMQIPSHKIKITLKNTTWATNNLKTRSISYSTLLIHYLLPVIDYVIIHELAHFIIPNHGQSFWEIVANFCPDFSKHRKTLSAAHLFKEDY